MNEPMNDETLLANAKAWWRTEIINIQPGQIVVRGYPIEQLIGQVDFVSMIWLMLRGELPTPAQAGLLQAALGLLRLQARRTNNAEGREALLESVRRVSSIALVHDALSMSVDEEVNLDEVIDRILPIMNDVASVDAPIRINRVGALGVLDADRATALIMVVTELVQNAIEHAFDPSAGQGSVVIRAERSARWLDVVVHDDGRGLPDGFSLEKSDSLGLQIVRTLVGAELDGSLGLHEAAGGGTNVVLRVPIGRRSTSRVPQ